MVFFNLSPEVDLQIRRLTVKQSTDSRVSPYGSFMIKVQAFSTHTAPVRLGHAVEEKRIVEGCWEKDLI